VNRPGMCNAVGTFGRVSYGDNCAGANVSRTMGLANNSLFPVGISSVQYTAVDAAGNTKACSFAVEVDDVQTPVISCPSSMTVGSSPGMCSTPVNYMAPTGSDNCPNSSIWQVGGLASGSVFSVGTTEVAYKIEDASLLSATCRFNVTVRDVQPPSIGFVIILLLFIEM